MDRLDEESADLDFLEENLKKTEALTGKMVLPLFRNILHYFDILLNYTFFFMILILRLAYLMYLMID